MTFLTFTLEREEEFQDQKLPTLDVKIWVDKNKIFFDFFEKPMSSNLVLHAKTAQSKSVSSQSDNGSGEEITAHQQGSSCFQQDGQSGEIECEDGNKWSWEWIIGLKIKPKKIQRKDIKRKWRLEQEGNHSRRLESPREALKPQQSCSSLLVKEEF